MADATYSSVIHSTDDQKTIISDTANIMVSLASKESVKESAKEHAERSYINYIRLDATKEHAKEHAERSYINYIRLDAAKESAKEHAERSSINYIRLEATKSLLLGITMDLKEMAEKATEVSKKAEAFETSVSNLLRIKNFDKFNLSMETELFVNAIAALENTRKKCADKYNSLKEVSNTAKSLLAGSQKKRKCAEYDTKRQCLDIASCHRVV
jgi:hypothetical protein